MIYVTSYHSPDIDGVACCIGYAELLKKLGTEAHITYYGDCSKEVEFVKKYTNYFPLIKHSGSYPPDAIFVLVDTSDPDALETGIDPEKVVEIYDHRELAFTDKFKNAKLNIEKVGSCATLIVELFQKNNLKPSIKTAIYLYSAIVSNTVNFKNKVTTSRDIKVAEWLKKINKLKNDYVVRMFEYKSKITDFKDLSFLIEQDYATKEIFGKKIGIAQIEIAGLEKTVQKYEKEIESIMNKIKNKERVNFSLFTGIDIVDGFNIIITYDKNSNEFFSKIFGLNKINKGHKTKEIIMRKQIWPKVEKYLRGLP